MAFYIFPATTPTLDFWDVIRYSWFHLQMILPLFPFHLLVAHFAFPISLDRNTMLPPINEIGGDYPSQEVRDYPSQPY